MKQKTGLYLATRRTFASWVLDSTPWIPVSRYWIPVFWQWTWILDSNHYFTSKANIEAGTRDEPLITYALEVNRYWDSVYLELAVYRILDSTSKIFTDSGFRKQKFPKFRNAITRGDLTLSPQTFPILALLNLVWSLKWGSLSETKRLELCLVPTQTL